MECYGKAVEFLFWRSVRTLDLLLGTIGAGLDKIAVNTSDPYCDPDRGGLWSGLIVIMTQAAFT